MIQPALSRFLVFLINEWEGTLRSCEFCITILASNPLLLQVQWHSQGEPLPRVWRWTPHSLAPPSWAQCWKRSVATATHWGGATGLPLNPPDSRYGTTGRHKIDDTCRLCIWYIEWFACCALFDFSFPLYQLVYDVQDGGGCFHLIAVNVSSEELEKYRIMGSEPPPVQ